MSVGVLVASILLRNDLVSIFATVSATVFWIDVPNCIPRYLIDVGVDTPRFWS